MADAGTDGPAGPFGYDLTAQVDAPVQQVWSWISETEQWKRWSFLTRSFRLRDGAPDPDGVGSLRRYAVGPFGSV
ncbi:MAG TPA: hypothetical protein VE991_09020, partial [Acidimicrobiales bacterium]|nr:hypothetical protein [Acidimicrobiales bacterium]